MKFFGRLPLFNEAGDGDGGGNGDAGGEKPKAPAPGPAAGTGDEAPVTRAEFQALMAKLDKLAEPPKVESPKKLNAPKGADDMPEWAKALNIKIDGLTEQRKADAVATRRQKLIDTALSGVPDANKKLAGAALQGLLVESGVSLDGDNVNIDKIAGQFADQLRKQFGESLYTVPGSPYKAVPKAANGAYDWSSFRDLSEVPPELIKHIPDDDYRRLRGGATSNPVLPGGGILPRSRLH